MKRGSAAVLSLLLLLAVPGGVTAQVFISARPAPPFSIGPLIVQASVSPSLEPITVDVLWGLAVPATRSALGLEQDLLLLWPGSVSSDGPKGSPDPTLRRYVEARGFTVVGDGRLPLFERNLYPGKDAEPAVPIPLGAPYIIFVREGLRPLGLESAATLVRIPWTPRLVNPTWLVNLRMTLTGFIKPEQAGWLQNTFWGRRYLLSIGFGDVNEQALFSMYLEHRDRVIGLANEPSQLVVKFAEADRLRIDEVFPQSSSRKISEVQENTEVVSFFLEPSAGRTPQVLRVRFGYFAGLQTWAPILIPVFFFVLGRVAGPFIERLARRVGGSVGARLHLGRLGPAPPVNDEGVILAGEKLDRIVPAETTYEQVLELCGREVEERKQLGAPGRRTLIYHGRRATPQGRPIFAWLSAVSHWDVEHHEVEISFQDGIAQDVQVRLRRSRLSRPGRP